MRYLHCRNPGNEKLFLFLFLFLIFQGIIHLKNRENVSDEEGDNDQELQRHEEDGWFLTPLSLSLYFFLVGYNVVSEETGIFPRKPKVISEEDKDRFSRSSSLCSLIIKINAKRIMNTKTAKDMPRWIVSCRHEDRNNRNKNRWRQDFMREKVHFVWFLIYIVTGFLIEF